MKALQQLTRQVNWNGLDVLVLDMPPGTGDTPITLCQQIPLSGTVIVSTPQQVALDDTIKGIQMYKKFNVPILGWIENMSYFECGKCKDKTYIFQNQSNELMEMLKENHIPLLGQFPLNPDISSGSDVGKPIVIAHPDHSISQSYLSIASHLLKHLL